MEFIVAHSPCVNENFSGRSPPYIYTPYRMEIFQNITTEDDINALTYDINPIGSEEEEQ